MGGGKEKYCKIWVRLTLINDAKLASLIRARRSTTHIRSDASWLGPWFVRPFLGGRGLPAACAGG
jgi:hypothetical protein